ncbi:hypothetical protein ACVR1G_05135 [Streptococcus dentasini]
MKLEYPEENYFPQSGDLRLEFAVTYTNGYGSKEPYQVTINSTQNNGRQYTLKKRTILKSSSPLPVRISGSYP